MMLAPVIRLAAEEYMCNKISDPAFIANITANQTRALFKKFKAEVNDATAIQVLQRVLLMTPENIHLNSFMYEPILDMADEHLRKLYNEVLAIK